MKNIGAVGEKKVWKVYRFPGLVHSQRETEIGKLEKETSVPRQQL